LSRPFTLYVNDKQHAVPNAKIKLFADDTNLSLHNINSDPVNLFATANIGMSQPSKWFTANRLSLNLKNLLYLL